MNKAILLIHGIGQLEESETLDEFVNGLLKSDEFKDKSYELNRSEVMINDIKAKCVSVRSGKLELDIYEYYWAHKTSDKVAVREIYHWVKETLRGAKSTWTENDELRDQFKGRYKRHQSYWFKMTGLLTKGIYVYYFVSVMLFFIKHIPLLNRLAEWFKRKSKKLLLSNLADIVIYTTVDKNDKNYQIKEQILGGATTMLADLAKTYDHVYVGGHSLGSVVAYDSVKRLGQMVQEGTITYRTLMRVEGLFTLGSPLDKLVFFFRKKLRDGKMLRGDFGERLEGVKKSYLVMDQDHYNTDFADQVRDLLPTFSWINFFHQNDPVSGFLDFYDVDDNIECIFEDRNANKWGDAHRGYWDHVPMYNRIVSEYIINEDEKSTDNNE